MASPRKIHPKPAGMAEARRDLHGARTHVGCQQLGGPGWSCYVSDLVLQDSDFSTWLYTW